MKTSINPFVHLHIHTHYSEMDSLCEIKELFAKADELGMPALAITDHGNMFGIMEFYNIAKKYPQIKPILGCEVNVTNHYNHRIKDAKHQKSFHLILLAKNYQGYNNLMEIVSLSHIEGMYYEKPRISHETIEKYAEGLVCLSGCIAGEIPQAILNGNIDDARTATQWYKNVFGDDFYFEVMLHQNNSLKTAGYQMKINEVIFELSKELDIKVVATNDVHFINKQDAPEHDVLVCMNAGVTIDTKNRLKYTQQEYLKNAEEMQALFPKHPEVIANTLEVADKIERYSIEQKASYPK